LTTVFNPFFLGQSDAWKHHINDGRNVGSDPIHRESQDAIGQWERDIDELEKYGFTREELALFKEQFRVHHDLMIRRSESVAVPVQALLDEAPMLRERMSEIFGRTDLVKAVPIQDTREIDELDGRLYVTIRELNAAVRRAIRAGRLTRQPPYYRFNHLRKAPRPTPTPPEG